MGIPSRVPLKPAQPALLPTGQNVDVSVLLLVLLLGSSFTRGLDRTRWESLKWQKRGFCVMFVLMAQQ